MRIGGVSIVDGVDASAEHDSEAAVEAELDLLVRVGVSSRLLRTTQCRGADSAAPKSSFSCFADEVDDTCRQTPTLGWAAGLEQRASPPTGCVTLRAEAGCVTLRAEAAGLLAEAGSDDAIADRNLDVSAGLTVEDCDGDALSLLGLCAFRGRLRS